MIRFIDVNTGNVYDGSKPYIHWFDGKQSVNLNYDKPFIILTDAEHVEIRTKGEVFYLVDNHKIRYSNEEKDRPVERTFHDKNYLDLDVLKTDYLSCTDGVVYGNLYIYSFNIIAQGKYVGEVTDTFTINGEEFSIGADFVDENESLGINLTNFGAEISNEVQRAIYEAPLDEQMTDYILINRKFKELLNEYINILGNKGSYKSLINSLNWFEYGDIVKLYEYWKHTEPNKNYLSKRDITQFVNEQTEELLYSNAKTTFIGISAALESIVKNDGEIVYEDKYDEKQSDNAQLVDEPNPELEKRVLLWSKADMSLKMVLLGNFFATYFLPIHLDLIHCTIEDIVYAGTLKMATLPKMERTDICDEINDIKCNIDKLYHLSNIETFTNPNTPFGFNHNTNFDETDEALEILGVDESLYPFVAPLDRMKAYNMQHFKGIGVLVPVKCTLYNVKNTAVITDASIKVYKYHTKGKDIVIDKTIERETNNIEHAPINNKVFINFNILIREIGKYKVQLEFRRSDGITYIKVFDFEVDGENHQLLGMYKIVPRYDGYGYDKETNTSFSIKDWICKNEKDTALPFGHVADYVFDPVHYAAKSPDERTLYTQFISATRENIYNTVHTNQVFIIKANKDKKGTGKLGVDTGYLENLVISKVNDSRYLVSLKQIIDNVNPDTGYSKISYVKDIVWFTMDRAGHFVDPSSEDVISEWTTDGDYLYLIGINTSPNIDDPYYSRYKIVQNSGSLKVWLRDMFIPYFYKLEKFGEVSFFDKVVGDLSPEDLYKVRTASNTYTLNRSDVVCFLPELRCVRRPKDFMWKYICKTNNTEITPTLFRKGDMGVIKEGNIQVKLDPNDNKYTETTPFPTILQPLFGRYDFRVLPSAGYYDVILNYKLDDEEEENQTKSVSSQFIIDKVDLVGATGSTGATGAKGGFGASLI